MHLAVSDMKRSIDFYTTILGYYYDHGVTGMAWLTRENMLLTLSPAARAEPGAGNMPAAPPAGYFGWCLESREELEQCYDALYARRQRLSAPPDFNAGRGYFFIYDPDDNPVAFSCDVLEEGEAQV